MSSNNTHHHCYCGRRFISPLSLRQHQDSSHQANLQHQHRCPHCDNPFTTSSAQRQHQKTCTTTTPKPLPPPPPPQQQQSTPHQCHCSKTFTSASALVQHKESVHPPCQHCGKVFGSASALRQHEDSVHRAKPTWKCECGKVFQSGEALAQHRIQAKAHRAVGGSGTAGSSSGGGGEEESGGVGEQAAMMPEIGEVEYSRFSEIVVGIITIGAKFLRARQPVESAKPSTKTGGGEISGTAAKKDGPSSTVPGGGRDLTMCDGECGWCGRCGEEYLP